MTVIPYVSQADSGESLVMRVNHVEEIATAYAPYIATSQRVEESVQLSSEATSEQEHTIRGSTETCHLRVTPNRKNCILSLLWSCGTAVRVFRTSMCL